MTGADLQVFLPGLMGLGVIVSGLVLVADAVHRLFPSRGLRRRSQMARRMFGVTTAAARAAGLELPEPEMLRREPRTRWIYLVAAVVGPLLAAYFVRAGFAAFQGPGRLHANNWAIGLGIVAALIPAMVAVFAAALALAGPRPSGRLELLVVSTWLGRHRSLPTDRAELIRSLVPGFGREEAPCR